MTLGKMNKKEVFKVLLDKFETEEVRLYCEDMIEQIPDYIFDMPSSTTGKHHNKTQCLPHGQIYHIIMFGTIANYRLGLKYNKEKKFPNPRIRDAIRCAAIFHDALKCGDGASQYTVHEHPLLAAEWVRTANVEHNIDAELKETIANMCGAHSGEWTTARRGSKTVLPEPQNETEIFVHECDYLASRSDIDMPIPEYLTEIFSESDANAVNNFDVDNYTVIIKALEGKSGSIPDKRNYKIRFRNTAFMDNVTAYFNNTKLNYKTYEDDLDFVIEVEDVPTIGQLTINAKGKDVMIEGYRVLEDDIVGIISDLQIETMLKEKVDAIIFGNLPINKKRVEIRKLKKKGLEKKYIKIFLKLLEYISEV